VQNLKSRLNRLFLPFIITGLSSLAVYSILHWTLIIKLQLVAVDDDVVAIWLPLSLSFIAAILLFPRRMRILSLNSRKVRLLDLYIGLLTLCIAVPTIIFQYYLLTATGKLTKLDTIGNINDSTATKYYAVNHYYIAKDLTGVKRSSIISGKNSQYLTYYLDIVAPIFDTPVHIVVAPPTASDTMEITKITPATADTGSIVLGYGDAPANTIDPTPAAWCCIEYKKELSNKVDYEEKIKKWKEFFDESMHEFEAKDINICQYFSRAGNNASTRRFELAVKTSPVWVEIKSSKVNLLQPLFESFEARNGNKLAWTLGAFGIAALVWFLMVIIPPLDQDQVQEKVSKTETKYMPADKGFKLLLIPREGYMTTPVIIGINVLIFLVMAIKGQAIMNFEAKDLLQWGGLYGPLTLHGEWWRLFTSMFMHGGLEHLVFNMIGLLTVGIFLEPAIGTRQYTTAYVVTGIISGLTSIWWHPNAVGVGASGAIFGLYGVLLALLLTKFFDPVFKRGLLLSTVIFVAYNLIRGLSGHVDNAAHIGGLLSGLAYGFLFYLIKGRPDSELS